MPVLSPLRFQPSIDLLILTTVGFWRSESFFSRRNTDIALERLSIAALSLHKLAKTPISRKLPVDRKHVGRFRYGA